VIVEEEDSEGVSATEVVEEEDVDAEEDVVVAVAGERKTRNGSQ